MIKNNTSQIQLLPDLVINKIAAGEVVERPASVLKELIENSLDADSTQININIVDGGKKLIEVSDNGIGLNKDDSILCIERHATSKIRDIDDIEHIQTMGFRGEALAAISSVSRFTLKTCPRNGIRGTEVTLSGGKLQNARETGCPTGTTITVRNLFFNVPARRKFLRAVQTEAHHLRQTFILSALSNPTIGWRFISDEREIFNLPGNSTFEERLEALFGKELFLSLKKISQLKENITLDGYIGSLQLHRSDRGEQYFFINNRPVTAPVLSYAVKEGYRSLLPKDRHPHVFLFLTIPPELIDVNVHPTKKEIRFHRPGEIRDLIIRGISSCFANSLTNKEHNYDIEAKLQPQFSGKRPEIDRQLDIFSHQQAIYPKNPQTQTANRLTNNPTNGLIDQSANELKNQSCPWKWHKIVGEVGDLYIVLETESGMVLMDPRAAHERVLFEQLVNNLHEKRIPIQQLLTPETLELTTKDTHLLKKFLKALQETGFEITEFGDKTFILEAVPACLSNQINTDTLIKIIHSLDKSGTKGIAKKWIEEDIARAVSVAAIRSSDKLSLIEIEKLIKDLEQTQMPYTSPQGRPTLIFMSYAELNRKFGRA